MVQMPEHSEPFSLVVYRGSCRADVRAQADRSMLVNDRFVSPIYEVLRIDDRAAACFPTIQGPTLAEMMGREVFSLEQINVVAFSLFAAVEALHAQGLVHGILRPSEFSMDLDDSDLCLKLMHHGVGLADGPVQLSESSPPWCDPAVERLEQFGEKSDVFSIGQILKNLLLARLEGDEQMLRDASSLEQQGIPNHMAQAVRRATIPLPNARWSSIAMMRERWFGGDVPASPPPADWKDSQLQWDETLASSSADAIRFTPSSTIEVVLTRDAEEPTEVTSGAPKGERPTQPQSPSASQPVVNDPTLTPHDTSVTRKAPASARPESTSTERHRATARHRKKQPIAAYLLMLGFSTFVLVASLGILLIFAVFG